MDIEKIVVPIGDKQYSFSVEVMQDEDETVYRVTLDQGERVLEDISPGYLEFNEKGILQVKEDSLDAQGKRVSTTIWEALKQQIEVTFKD